MKDWRIIGIIILIAIFSSIGGCISSDFSNTSQQIVDTTLPRTSTIPQDCIIDNNQSGTIEILELRYAYEVRGKDGRPIYPIDDERLFGTAKNAGTNMISGTIEYQSVLVDVVDDKPHIAKYLQKYSFKFCNIKPDQKFRFNFPDFNAVEQRGAFWTQSILNAGQNITTTGMGPRRPVLVTQ